MTAVLDTCHPGPTLYLHLVISLLQSVVIRDDDADKFRSEFRTLDILKITLVAVGGAILLICIILAIVYVIKKKRASRINMYLC